MYNVIITSVPFSTVKVLTRSADFSFTYIKLQLNLQRNFPLKYLIKRVLRRRERRQRHYSLYIYKTRFCNISTILISSLLFYYYYYCYLPIFSTMVIGIIWKIFIRHPKRFKILQLILPFYSSFSSMYLGRNLLFFIAHLHSVYV